MIRRAKPLLGTLIEIAVESVVEEPSQPTLDEQAIQAAITAAFSRITQIGRLLNFHHSVTCLNAYGAMGARFSR